MTDGAEHDRAPSAGGGSRSGCDVSVLLECDNARRKGRARAAEALDALAAELADRPATTELLVGVPGDTVPDWLTRLLRSSGTSDAVGERLRVVTVGDAGYHGTKHTLAQLAGGRILVFVDIDVIVQPGWMESLLAPFEDPDVASTFGYTRIGPTRSAYDRAMSATWIFDPRRPAEGGPDHPFRSNNVAFRTEVYAAHPFRPYPGEHRGAGTRLHRELVDAGLHLERVDATTLHPPLTFPVDFVLWSLLSGRDRARREVAPGRRPPPGGPPGARERRLATLRARARAAGVRPIEVPVVLAVGGSIRLLRTVGGLIGRMRPQLLDRWV